MSQVEFNCVQVDVGIMIKLNTDEGLDTVESIVEKVRELLDPLLHKKIIYDYDLPLETKKMQV